VTSGNSTDLDPTGTPDNPCFANATCRVGSVCATVEEMMMPSEGVTPSNEQKLRCVDTQVRESVVWCVLAHLLFRSVHSAEHQREYGMCFFLLRMQQ
jgi:hypothetical protein